MKLQFFVSCLFLVSAGSALAQAPLYDIPGAPNGGVRGMSAVGDLDGDGLGDLLIGSPFADGLVADSGIVRVISSKTTGTVLTLKGEHASDYFGWSVAGLDDINGDGVDEIVVGAPGHDWSATVTDSGAVYLFSGANGALIKKFNWGNDGEEYGHSVCAIGDYNLDGKADFAIGVPKGLSFPAVEGGNVIPISGATLNQLAFIESYGLFEHFGRSIARVGDLNGDGREEFIVGAPDYDAPGAVDAGRAMVLAGGSGTVLFTVTGTQVNQKLGTSVGGVADVNGDGKNEFAAGEHNYT